MELFKLIHPTTGRSIEVSKGVFEEFISMNKAEQSVRWPRILEMIKATEQTILLPEPAKQDSIAATLAQRGSRYGDFTDHAELCQHLKEVMMTQTVPENGGMLAWDKLSAVQKQALEVIADKIARILIGDPNYDDNWHDIQGYAKLVEDRLPKEKKES